MATRTIQAQVTRPLRFAAFGDSGSGRPAQQAVANQLIALYRERPFCTVMMLGDNIYPKGEAFRYGLERFTRQYQPLLDEGVLFLPALGNHDISGPLGVGFPTFWRSNEGQAIRFFGMPGPYYDVRMGDVHLFVINTNRFSPEQRDWLKHGLSNSLAPWKIVCGHHPVYSSGRHGSGKRMNTKLKPLLERHGAQLYLSGHEHDYERFEPIHGVNYIVSGGGGAELRGFGKPLPHSRVRLSEHHFMLFELDGDRLRYEAINVGGTVIDSGEIHLRPPMPVHVRHPHRVAATAR